MISYNTKTRFFKVVYEESFEKELFDDKDIVKSATCLLMTGNEPMELLNKLPPDIESLTLIQGSDSGNKTFKFSYLEDFEKLISLEILGSKTFNTENASYLTCELDRAISKIKYLNLEKIHLKNSKEQTQKFVNEVDEEVITFEYVDKHDSHSHPLTMLRKNPKQILPYNKYLQQEKNNDAPLFIGFDDLVLLRIVDCELNNVQWEMFDGLQHLKYLILEKNNLRFIPDFAFYGTPNLKSLSLAWNNLLNIQITDLAGLLELEYLDLSHNNFSQLSELSLPPFPKLKLANFANNPITVIYPNTFEVMNTTDSLIVGGDDTSLSILANSFLGLIKLKTLTVHQLNIPVLKRELLTGMPNLNALTLTGNITEIEFDAFLEVVNLESLTMSGCNIYNLSMDSFIGLQKLTQLDLSNNRLSYLPPGVFDQMPALRELFLHKNEFTTLARDIFSKLHVRLLRLNENPWHCSCDMSEWKPMIVNKVKQREIKPCEVTYDKMVSCTGDNRFSYKYVYEPKIAPRCATPEIYQNWNVFHVMRRQFKCPDYKPKLKRIKHVSERPTIQSTTPTTYSTSAYTTTVSEKPEENYLSNTFKKVDLLNEKYLTHKMLLTPEHIFNKNDGLKQNFYESDSFNKLSPVDNAMSPNDNLNLLNSQKYKVYRKIRKFKKF